MDIKINLYKRQKIDAVGWFVCVLEADADVSHATIQIDDMEYTTGATWHWLLGPLYGSVVAKTYQAKRGMYVCTFTDPLTDAEQKALLASCQSLKGRRYGFATIAKLMLAKYRGFRIRMLGDTPKLTIDSPICSEAVVWHCWNVINRPLCMEQNKLEPQVCSPQTIFNSALYGRVLRIVDET